MMKSVLKYLLILSIIMSAGLLAQNSNVPTSKEALFVESSGPAEVVIISTGIGIHVPKNRFDKPDQNELTEGAKLDAKDSNGRTALLYASSGPFTETVGLLLKQGAEVNTQGTLEGFTALMTAAAEGQLEVVRLLLEHGADPSLKDKDGDTAESFAEIGRREIKKVPTLRGRTVVNFFIEPSTRTRTSFELAEKRLSADTLNFSASKSSFVKGETLLDTARNLEAMAPDFIVSSSCIHHLANDDKHVRVVGFRRNYGQTAAMQREVQELETQIVARREVERTE